jgi:hypothetical protein
LTDGAGHTNRALTATVTSTGVASDTTNLQQAAASVAYAFYSFSTAPPQVSVFALPTHPLHNHFRMWYGISIDDGPVQIADFKR